MIDVENLGAEEAVAPTLWDQAKARVKAAFTAPAEGGAEGATVWDTVQANFTRIEAEKKAARRRRMYYVLAAVGVAAAGGVVWWRVRK